MTESCTNCRKYADSETKTPNSANPEVNGENGDLRIWDVIAYVYRMGSISLGDFKTHLKKVNDQEDCENKDLKEVEESLGMCDLCLSLLSDTYKTLKKFESLTHHATLIQKIQNVCTKNWQNRAEVVPSLVPVSDLILSSPFKTGDEDLFESYNFEDNQLDELEDCFAEDRKCETADDLFETESFSLPLKEPVDHIPKQSFPKMSLRSSKQLVVKLERISDKDLEYYNENKNAKLDCRVLPVERRGRKVKPVRKLQYSTAVKRKYTNQQKKGQPSTPKDKKKYECHVCGERCYNRNIHLKSHFPTHFQDMSCKLCDKVLSNVKSMKVHMKTVHKQASEEFLKRTYKPCEICGKTIRSDSFKYHMETHGARKYFKCDKCDKEYLDKFIYNQHLLTHSDNFTPLLCRHCGRTCKDKKALYGHEKKHTDENKYSCDICSKVFNGKQKLKCHMSVHSIERKLFVCDECGLSYKLKNGLRRHQRLHKELSEKGEYSSKCNYCGRLFKHSASLRHHVKSHEKNLQCSFCGKKIATALRLRQHENLHKNNPDYQPRKSKTWKSDLPYQLIKSNSEIK